MPSAVTPLDPGVVEVRETGRGQFQVEVRVGTTRFHADEPIEAGGLDSGPTPYGLLAAALGACTVMTLRMYASRKAWPLEDVSVRVLHRRDRPTARDRFAREIVLHGGLTREQRRRLLEIANRCPVHLTLEQGSEVITTLAEAPGLHGPRPTDDDHVRDMSEAAES